MADQPAVGESRTSNGETRVWNSSRWMLTGGSLGPLQMPPRLGPSGRTDQQDLDVLKNFMNIGGAALAATPFGAASLPLRMGAAALGGMVGRTAGHGIEAMNKAARHDESGPSLGADVGQGLVEGAGAEVAPAIVGKALGLGGRGLQAVGDFLGSGASPAMRGWIGHTVGGAPGAATAAFGPPAISAVGSGAERAGEAIGTRTLSQRLKDALENSSFKSLFGEGTAVADPYAPNVSGYRPGSMNQQAAGVRYEPPGANVSNVSGYRPGMAASEQAVGVPYEAPSAYTPNVSGRPDLGTTRFQGAQQFQPSVNQLMENVSGYRAGAPASEAAIGVPYEPTIQQYSPNVSGYNAERMATHRAMHLKPDQLLPEELPTHNFVARQESVTPRPEPYESARETLLSRRGSDARMAFEGETPLRGGVPNAPSGQPMTINDVEIPASLRPFYGTPTLEDQMTRELQTLLPQQSRLPAYR